MQDINYDVKRWKRFWRAEKASYQVLGYNHYFCVDCPNPKRKVCKAIEKAQDHWDFHFSQRYPVVTCSLVPLLEIDPILIEPMQPENGCQQIKNIERCRWLWRAIPQFY